MSGERMQADNYQYNKTAALTIEQRQNGNRAGNGPCRKHFVLNSFVCVCREVIELSRQFNHFYTQSTGK